MYLFIQKKSKLALDPDSLFGRMLTVRGRFLTKGVDMIKFFSFVSCLVVCAASYAGDASILTPADTSVSVLKTDSASAAPAATTAYTTVAAAPATIVVASCCNNCNSCNDGCINNCDSCCKKRERAFSRSRTHTESVTCQNCQQVKESTDTVETSRKRLNGNVIKRSRSRTSLSVR